MLNNIISVSAKYRGVYLLAVVTALVSMGVLVLSVCTITGLIVGQEDNNLSLAACIIMVIFAILYIFWALIVIGTTARLTVSGVFARYCYMGICNGQTVELPLKNPTLESAKRALTTNFGTSCYFFNFNNDVAQIAIYGVDRRTARKSATQLYIKSQVSADLQYQSTSFLLDQSSFFALLTVIVSSALQMFLFRGPAKFPVFIFAFLIGYVGPWMTVSLFSCGSATMFVCL
jgi:hypothetical protein